MSYPAEFLATVIEVGNEVASIFEGDLNLLDCVYKDFSNQPGVKGATTSIVIPGAFTVNDGANADITLQTPSSTAATITLSNMPEVSFPVHDFNQARANPNMIKNAYIEPALKALADYANGLMGARFVAATYNSYSPVASAAARTLTKSQLKAARIALRNAKVPVDDRGDMFLVMPPELYEVMLNDDDFSKREIVGEDQATSARQRAKVLDQFNTTILPDIKMNVATQMNSALFHRWAIGAAIRPLEIPQGVSAKGAYMMWRGIPIRVMIDWSIVKKAWILSFDFLIGLTTLRKECCQIIYSALS